MRYTVSGLDRIYWRLNTYILVLLGRGPGFDDLELRYDLCLSFEYSDANLKSLLKARHMLRNWPIIALALVLIVVIGVSGYTDPSNQDKQNRASNSSPATNSYPNEAGQASQDAQTSKRSPFWRRIFAWPEGVTTLSVIATLFFIGWQAMLMRQTVRSSEDSSKRELRAYIAVVIGDAIFQVRRDPPLGDLRFEARPVLTNTGRTPAHNIRFKARAAILPVPLPPGMDLPITHDADIGEIVIGINQTAYMSAVVDGFVQDADVADIKLGVSRSLYVWGRVVYNDVFGDQYETLFCHQIYWTGETVRGYYAPRRNKST
jgi:hypothetical protein